MAEQVEVEPVNVLESHNKKSVSMNDTIDMVNNI